jgi:arylsulfatase
LDETFDVGVDTRTSANDSDYHVPFRFTGATKFGNIRVLRAAFLAAAVTGR